MTRAVVSLNDTADINDKINYILSPMNDIIVALLVST